MDKRIKCTHFFEGVAIHETDAGRFEVEMADQNFGFATLNHAKEFVKWAQMKSVRPFYMHGNETSH